MNESTIARRTIAGSNRDPAAGLVRTLGGRVSGGGARVWVPSGLVVTARSSELSDEVLDDGPE
jgi:hypothetical protein